MSTRVAVKKVNVKDEIDKVVKTAAEKYFLGSTCTHTFGNRHKSSMTDTLTKNFKKLLHLNTRAEDSHWNQASEFPSDKLRFFVDLDFDLMSIRTRENAKRLTALLSHSDLVEKDNLEQEFQNIVDLGIEWVCIETGCLSRDVYVSLRTFYQIRIHFHKLIVTPATAVSLCNKLIASVAASNVSNYLSLETIVCDYSRDIPMLWCETVCSDMEMKLHHAAYGTCGNSFFKYRRYYVLCDREDIGFELVRRIEHLEWASIHVGH